jgi:O-antigen ligase
VAPRAARPTAERAGFLLTGLLFLALNLQMVTFSGQVAEGIAVPGPALKVYHVLFAGFGLLLLARGRIVRWRPEMLAYFAVVGATTLVASLRFDAQPVVVNMVFAAYAATLGATAGAMAGEDGAIRALRWTSVVMLVAVLGKAAINLPAILQFLAAPYGHPMIPSFYGGGANLEASWVAMGAVFLIGSPLFIPYMLGSAAISVAYASRVGLIIVALVAIASVAGSLTRARPGGRGRRWLVPLAIVGLTVVGVSASRGVTGADYIAQRFQSIGDDPGSVGRLVLWRGGLAVFAEHPLGVGIGNAVLFIERSIGANLPEDNLHNQYLQHLVECGIQGLVAYLFLSTLAFRRVLRTRFADPAVLYVGIYFLLALLQFRGAEALLWFVYGVHSGYAPPRGVPAEAPTSAPSPAPRVRPALTHGF